MAMKKLKKEGKLADQEESDEINACSIVVPLEVDGKTEEWLVNFKNETHNHPTEIEPFGGAATIASTLAWGLGYFGMPHILLRFMGIEDENKLKTSRRIASVWVVISMFIAIFIGIIGNAMTKAGAMDVLESSSQSETLIVRTAVLLSNHGFLAVLMAGLILAGILASTMSTSDSQLLAASSSISENLLQDCFGIKCTKKQSMLMARITVLVIAAISVFLARNPDSSVFRIVSFAWAGFGATFGAVMLFALFWKRSNRNGALAGMIVGGTMVFIWKFLIAPHGGLLGIYELLPAFLCSAAAIVIVSLLTAPKESMSAILCPMTKNLSRVIIISRSASAFTLAFTRPERFLFGTDWPAVKCDEYVKFIASLFDEKEIEQVLRYNAYQAYNIKYDTRTCVNDQ